MSDDKSLQEKLSAAISTRDILINQFYQKPRTLDILDCLAIINNEIKDTNHSITRRFEKTRSEEQRNQWEQFLSNPIRPNVKRCMVNRCAYCRMTVYSIAPQTVCMLSNCRLKYYNFSDCDIAIKDGKFQRCINCFEFVPFDHSNPCPQCVKSEQALREFDIDYNVGKEEEVQDEETTCMDISSLPELS